MGDLWLVLSLLGFGVSAFFLGVTRADAKWIKRGQDNVLWVIEHGARGGDELNLVGKGAHSVWPVVAYGEE